MGILCAGYSGFMAGTPFRFTGVGAAKDTSQDARKSDTLGENTTISAPKKNPKGLRPSLRTSRGRHFDGLLMEQRPLALPLLWYRKQLDAPLAQLCVERHPCHTFFLPGADRA